MAAVGVSNDTAEFPQVSEARPGECGIFGLGGDISVDDGLVEAEVAG